MKKLFILVVSLFAFTGLNAQTQVPIGPQSSSFTSWVRGYFFTAPVNFTICGIYVPPDMSTAAQNCAIVRFTAGAPPAFPGTTNAFTLLYQNQNYAPNSMISINVPVAAGDIIGVYGSRGNTCINSYDGTNFATNIMGFPTTLQRSGMQNCLQSVAMSNIWSEVAYQCGRIFIYYNCCTVPTVTASATPTSVCTGMNVALLGGGASTYTWAPGNIVGSSINVNPTVTTQYTVTGTSAAGCSNTATVGITVNPNPTITPVANPASVCTGQTSNLTGAGASTYTWQPGNIVGAAITVTPASTTVYTVIGSSASGCTDTKTVQVTVNSLPAVNPNSNSPVCLGGNIILTVGASTSYTWTGPNSFSSNLQNPTITNANASMGGIYTVTVTNASGCTSSNTVNVVVNPLPAITPTNTGPYCAGQTINLSTAAAATYTWSGPNAFASNLQNPTIASAQPINSGTYSVSVTSAGGCISSGTTAVTVNALPVPAANNTGPYCPGNTIQLSTGAFTSYTWTGPSSFNSNIQNATQSNAQTVNSGIYTVAVTDGNGCTNTATTNVVVNPSPVPNAGSNSPVCLNFPLNLTSNPGGGTYAWSGPNSFTSNQQNPTIPNATAVNAGVYTLTVTTLGCSAVGSVTVTVTTPTVAAANAGPFCAGTTMSLSSTAASTFTWSGPAGFNSSFQNPTQANATVGMTGTYTVLVSIGSCTASATTNVIVNALPTPTVQSNSPVCAGQTINLMGGGGTTYTWSGPGSYSSNASSPNIPNATASNNGNYILVVTDNNGCSDSANVNVVVNSLPVIAVNNPTNCVNTTINLTSNGGVTYTWTGPNSYSSNQQNPSITSAQINMTGVYVVTVTDANNCVNTASANVLVLPLPTPNIVSNDPLCVGGTLNLQGSGGAAYAWSGPGYTGLSQNPTINNVTIGAAGVYTLLVSSGTCTASTTYTVVINPLPVFNFSNSNVLCNAQSNGTSTVNVTVGTNPYNYQWSNGQTTQAATNLTAGSYTCVVTDANNCSSMSSTQITQPTAFSVSINSSTTSACANSPINLTANGSGGTGSYTYSWVSGPSAALYPVNESVSGNYSYTVNALDANNCPASNVVNLTFFPQPTVTATSATLCAGQSTNLTASGAATYTWQPGNVTGGSYPFAGNTSVNVTVIGSMNGCSNSATASISVHPNPNASINTTANKSCAPSCVTFTATGSSNITSYGWLVNGLGISGAQIANYCFPESGTYTLDLTVMDNNGCTANAAPVGIEVYPNPIADFNFAPLKPIVNVDQEVTFTDASWGTPIVSWNWYFMNTAQYTSVLQNPTFSYTEPGNYAVALVVKSDKGCLDTLVRELVVGEDFGIYVPNAFTPNGDGLNDIFQPKGFGVTKYELNVYDRWGELMFHTNTFEEGWNGAKQKKMDVSYPQIIEEGVYTWQINCTSVFGKSHELKGHVTLIR